MHDVRQVGNVFCGSEPISFKLCPAVFAAPVDGCMFLINTTFVTYSLFSLLPVLAINRCVVTESEAAVFAIISCSCKRRCDSLADASPMCFKAHKNSRG